MKKLLNGKVNKKNRQPRLFPLSLSIIEVRAPGERWEGIRIYRFHIAYNTPYLPPPPFPPIFCIVLPRQP